MYDKWAAAVQDLAEWIKEGKIKTNEAEQVVEAKFDDVPEIWQRLFHGANRGKLVTHLVV
jgi:NADPH-dependent curcumin reductase CurA